MTSPANLRAAACAVLLIAGGVSCTSVSGLDDLAFDLAYGGSGGSSSGVGGSGGSSSGVGGSGGVVELCADQVDVPGVSIYTGGDGALSAPTVAAASSGRVGSLWNVGADVLEIIITDPGGNTLLDDGIGPHPSPSYRTSIAASGTHFAIAFAMAANVQMRFYVQATALQDGQALGVSLPISQTGEPRQAHVAAGSDGNFLMTAARAGGDFFHGIATRQSGDWTATAVSPSSNGTVCCCGSRAWSAVGGDRYFVASLADCAATSWRLEMFDLDGASLGLGQIANTTAEPQLGLRLGDEVIFANCSMLVRLDASGLELGRTSLPGTGPGSCVIGSSGQQLRWGVTEAGTFRWHDLDPVSGVGAELLSLDLGADQVPAVSWDGSGFAVMWALPTGEPAYARIGCN